MAFIFCGDEDYSGHEDEPEEALGSLLAHVEFDSEQDLWAMAHGIKANVDFVHLVPRPNTEDPGVMGYHKIHQDGSHEVVMHCRSALIFVHELAHCYLRQQKNDHGPLFKKRMAKLIEKAEAWLDDKIEVYDPQPTEAVTAAVFATAIAAVPEARSEAPLLLEQVPFWTLFEAPVGVAA